MNTCTEHNSTHSIPLQLSEPLRQALWPLFNALPPAQALGDLVVVAEPSPECLSVIETALEQPALEGRPELAAGLWLYVDALDRSHQASQQIETPTGSFWHAVMHRREGDFSNSHYWYRRTGKHPAMNRISIAGGGAGSGTSVGRYDPHEFVDRVERAHVQANHRSHPELVSVQRREWFALFEWCAEQ